jgi:hypothetical protein
LLLNRISASASKFGAESRGYGYKNDGSKTNNNSDASYGATYTTGDIIGCALDLTNGAIYFSKNGAWQNSATTSEIAAGTTTNAAYTSISSSYVYLTSSSNLWKWYKSIKCWKWISLAQQLFHQYKIQVQVIHLQSLSTRHQQDFNR